MLDHHASDLRALPALHVYDRGELERYLASVEAHAGGLHRRLAEARARRLRAEQALAAAGTREQRELAVSLLEARTLLGQEQVDHERVLDELRASTAEEARRILREAEREALDLRAALREVLDELAEPVAAPAPRDAGPADPSGWSRPAGRPQPAWADAASDPLPAR